jgi:hypothetical protein
MKEEGRKEEEGRRKIVYIFKKEKGAFIKC